MGRHTVTALAMISMAAASMAANAAPPAYKADAGSSHLQFTGVQAGAEFKGEFHQFTAVVVFAPDALADSHFDVQIDLDSLDTKDKDRDKTMRGPDIFDVARFRSAHYVTKSFAKTATGYTASGSLTLHGVTRDVPLEFRFTPAAAGATLAGTAQLKRLEFGVGQGDWKSTEWVADAVKVSFTLALKPGP